MTDAQLTALSTIAWVIGTATVFVLIAHWSAGGSWGISSAIARGLIGWAGRNGSFAGESPAPPRGADEAPGDGRGDAPAHRRFLSRSGWFRAVRSRPSARS